MLLCDVANAQDPYAFPISLFLDGSEVGIDTLTDQITISVGDCVHQVPFTSVFYPSKVKGSREWYSTVLLPKIKKDSTDSIILTLSKPNLEIVADFTGIYNHEYVYIAIRHEGLKFHVFTKKRHFRKNKKGLEWSIRGVDIKEPEKGTYPTAFIGASYTDCCAFKNVPLSILILTKPKTK